MTIRFDGTFIYETTALPCPAWCELQTGHELLHMPGGVERHHTWTFGAAPLTVEITDYETADVAEGPATTVERTMLLAPCIEDRNLSSAGARQLAAALLNAADALDSISPDASSRPAPTA